MTRAPLIFIHGAGETADVWREQHEAFGDAHFLTLPGHSTGGSASTIDEFVAYVDSYRTHVGVPVTLVANSMGAAVALTYALAHPQAVRSAVLIGCGPQLRVADALLAQLRSDFPRASKAIASYSFSKNAAPHLAQWAENEMLRIGQAQTLRDFLICAAFDVRNEAAALSIPLLIVMGGKDVMTPPASGRALRDLVPNARYVEIADAGHLAMLEAPDDVTRAIAEFVAD